ncbi:hypothetical protein EMIT0215P_30247 [Pseudomonas serboccidentalis]
MIDESLNYFIRIFKLTKLIRPPGADSFNNKKQIYAQVFTAHYPPTRNTHLKIRKFCFKKIYSAHQPFHYNYPCADDRYHM